jgi:hypothetical protein
MRKKDLEKTHPPIRRQYRMVYSSLHLGLGTDVRSSHIVASVALYFHSLHPLHLLQPPVGFRVCPNLLSYLSNPARPPPPPQKGTRR